MLPALPTILLNRAEVARHTDALALLHDLRDALRGGVPPTIGDDPRAGAHPSIPARSVTLEGTGPAQLHLIDVATGALLARLEADALIWLRACLVTALAVDALGVPEAGRIAVLGAGPQAGTMLKTLRLVRSLREAWLVAPTLEQAVVEAAQLQQTLHTPVRAVEHAVDALEKADLVVLCGGVALPEVSLWPSVQLSVPSARRFDTPPLPVGVLARAWRVSDAPGTHWGQPVQAELGAVLAQTVPRPSGSNALFIGADPRWLDLVAAWHVYLGAQSDEALLRADFEP